LSQERPFLDRFGGAIRRPSRLGRSGYLLDRSIRTRLDEVVDVDAFADGT
jgi:hypothetical protein